VTLPGQQAGDLSQIGDGQLGSGIGNQNPEPRTQKKNSEWQNPKPRQTQDSKLWG